MFKSSKPVAGGLRSKQTGQANVKLVIAFGAALFGAAMCSMVPDEVNVGVKDPRGATQDLIKFVK